MKTFFITIFFILFLQSSFASNWPAEIKLGLIPIEGGSNEKERFTPLAEYLEKKLKIKVKLFSASDYAGIITALEHDHIDLAYLGAKTYIEAYTKTGAQIVVRELNEKGFSGYKGVIITGKNSGIKSMAEIKGKTFAFIDPNSTSGYLIQAAYFKTHTPPIDPGNYFKELKFAGSHVAAILSAKNNLVDLAATNEIDIERMVEAGQIAKDDVKILWTSELVPQGVIVARKGLPADLVKAIQKALLAVPLKIKAKLQDGGFTLGKDTDYDYVRYLMKIKDQLSK
ncbi:MAG: phosphonate ABC transporter substrate-binding protein [Bdellovibrionales bacterium RIFOXYB1_FULL_37_110]|nr:MAG: phosphonate ABC transporter substrate-binding protein [Bdellovibrionales bacterium RIFOXYC1_FULL_37_79]OFZ57107.1 MAG: phosphonate ABC transporter substrate-binding protein [Bdellovibrionales bacterium RIFOXYB1_FULL_37_110]OFZ65409.1 MAG: phosphonate ABC transporter substrate-binding protein [Bdellovibrionales bacterium RIFOXYD1_FULL_36_51]